MKNPFRKIKSIFYQYKEARELMEAPGYPFVRALPPGHFYSPIPDVEEVKGRNFSLDRKRKEIPGIDLNVSKQLDLVESFAHFYSSLPWNNTKDAQSLRYHFDNIFFSYGDAVALYSIMRTFQPKRIIEVGSGFSSAAILDVNQEFFDNKIEFTFIEPNADRLRSLFRADDITRNTLLEQPVQQVELSEFEKLEKGDILFVDSSHVSKIGSDINFLVHQVLPCLKEGVVIHFHDVLWPFEYPKKWLRAGRAWNEAYLLRAFLQYNSSFEVLFYNSFLEQHHRKKIREKLPLMLREPEAKITPGNSSLWLRRK